MVFLQIIQIVSAVTLIVSVLLQGGGVGLSSPFGGGGEAFRTRRGVEKLLYYITVAAAVIFVFSVIANLLA